VVLDHRRPRDGDPRDGELCRDGAAAVSAIASFYLLNRSAIPGLAQAAKAGLLVIPAAKSRRPAIGYLRNLFGRWNPTSPVYNYPTSPVYNYLRENDLGVSGGLWDQSGYPLWYLMGFLEDAGIELGTAEYGAETDAVNAVYEQTWLVTSADKHYLPNLVAARVDRAAAERYFTDCSYDLEEMRQIINDGLPLLHRLIAGLKESEVLVINIG
jgi:hypothetical protein